MQKSELNMQNEEKLTRTRLSFSEFFFVLHLAF